MENNFDYEKLTRIVTEKFGNLSDENFDVDDVDFDENKINEQFYELTNELQKAIIEENKPVVSLGFINKSSNKDPEYVYDGDSGFDLRANCGESITLKPLERFVVPTGLYFKIPVGYELQVRQRSGLSAKKGLTVLNTPGTVDQGYTGEIKIILVNLSNETTKIIQGDRIAQAVLCPVLTKLSATLSPVDSLVNTDRGDGGFGSTGKN